MEDCKDPEQKVNDLFYAEATPSFLVAIATTAAWMLAAGAFASVLLNAVKVWGLGQYNSYLGKGASFVLSVVVDTLVVTGAFGLWIGMAHWVWRHPWATVVRFRLLAAVVAVILVIVSVAPVAVDIVVTGNGKNDEGGNPGASGVGEIVKWYAIIALPPSDGITIRRGGGDVEEEFIRTRTSRTGRLTNRRGC